MLTLIGSIVSGLFGLGQTYMKRRGEVAHAKHERELRRLNADAEWEQTMAQGSVDSWKDEFWTMILAVPLILVFFPVTREWVREGFEALQVSVPEWYLYALSVAIGAAFGVRQVVGSITKLKGNTQ